MIARAGRVAAFLVLASLLSGCMQVVPGSPAFMAIHAPPPVLEGHPEGPTGEATQRRVVRTKG
ncbi:MAG TPA: hypothetical protein VM434_20920 [Beijerinckiaceae bacterium]|nr:hypothetical protein [Beijerinckiaceae bacterium]